jgi:ankyrin repeat protein
VLALLVVCDKPNDSRLNKYNTVLCQACRPKEDIQPRNPVFPRHYLGLKKETLDSLKKPYDIYYQKVIVHLLVQYGVPMEVERSESSPYTPLYLAVFTDCPSLAETLLHKYQANPLFKTYEGETTLSIGIHRSNYDTVKLFSALPSNVWKTLLWTPNFLGEYPIHYAAMGGNPKIIKLLLECELPIRQKQFMGQNILHLSANIANKRGFELLFDHIHKSSPAQLKEMLNEKDKVGGKPLSSPTVCGKH